MTGSVYVWLGLDAFRAPAPASTWPSRLWPAYAPSTMLISGTDSPDHLLENVQAGEVKLDADAMQALDGG